CTGTGPAWQTLIQSFLLIVAVLILGAASTAAFLRFGQPFLWISAIVLALIGLAIVAAVLLIDGFGRDLLDRLTMRQGPWLHVIAAIGALSAAVWLHLVRRTQVP